MQPCVPVGNMTVTSSVLYIFSQELTSYFTHLFILSASVIWETVSAVHTFFNLIKCELLQKRPMMEAAGAGEGGSIL